MANIIILPDLLINKIAAGEVIERPASVVRELVDNSVDAGARRISVDVLHGGKKLIRVADDGSGMDRDDAGMCFERHATSKIQSEENLFHITTLGFRGEALASIGAVSRVTLFTSRGSSGTGTRVEFNGDSRKRMTDAPPVGGTTVEIRDIFYNTPARRKFLKSTSTELSHIIGTVTQKALAYPHISFLLTHNGGEIINVSPAQDLRERFFQLYGEEFSNDFFEVREQRRGIELQGFCSVPGVSRATRSYQHVFINTRPVKNPTVSHAVNSAYRDVIDKDRHPAFFLFLDLDPGSVDVNVHPAKREVRFESSEEIHRFVLQAIQGALQRQRGQGREYQHSREHVRPDSIKAEASDSPVSPSVHESLEAAFQGGGTFQQDFFDNKTAPAIGRYVHIGDAFVADITGEGLMIVDRHAAHERVLFEKLLRKTHLEIEGLLLPLRVDLPAREYTVLMNNRDLLSDFGIDIGEFGRNNAIVRALPRELRRADVHTLLLDAASLILERDNRGTSGDEPEREILQRELAARLACHRSVRGREPLNEEEMNQLVADLEKTDVPDTCPHGRPTRIFISLDDLRRMFKRR